MHKKGYSMSDVGLKKRFDGKKLTSVPYEITAGSEEAAFKLMGIPYKTPAERDI